MRPDTFTVLASVSEAIQGRGRFPDGADPRVASLTLAMTLERGGDPPETTGLAGSIPRRSPLCGERDCLPHAFSGVSSGSKSCTGWPGMMVEIACL